MFSDLLEKNQITTIETQNPKVTSYQGIDLSAYQCHVLKPDPVYEKYNSSNVHFAINAMQKGLKPPTEIGLKRARKKHFKKKLKNLASTPMRRRSD